MGVSEFSSFGLSELGSCRVQEFWISVDLGIRIFRVWEFQRLGVAEFRSFGDREFWSFRVQEFGSRGV